MKIEKSLEAGGGQTPERACGRPDSHNARQCGSVFDEQVIRRFPTYMFCHLWDSRAVQMSRLISLE